jgi:bifunctional ADP-heptose synthase (sugar kinase/adenylyltransferase)
VKVLVIGDSCKDVFVYGKCDRLAPAAPVPVFVPLYSKENTGMAGNVCENLIAMGVNTSLLTNKKEITKTRYVEEKTNHIIVRIDSGEEKIDRIKNLSSVSFKDYDAIVISDYNKGFLKTEDVEYISNEHDLIFMDTKKLIGDWAKNIAYIKINEEEYGKTKHLIKDKKWIDEKLIVTIGSRGCRYKDSTLPVKKVEIKDLTGAGDTFMAALVHKYLQVSNILDALIYANECATQVVQQKGVNTIGK